jgi:hypothetical protein
VCAASAIGLVACGAKNSAPAAAPAGASASGSASSAAVGEAETGDLEALDKRELPPQGTHPFEGGGFQGEVESAAAATVTPGSETNAMEVVVPLGGTASPMHCWIYPQPIDPGQQLSQVLQSAAKSLTMKLIAPKEIAVVGDAPAVFVDAQYLAEGDKGKMLGILKVMVYANDDAPTLCIHDQVGYHGTFKRVASAFAGSLKHPGVESKTPRFVELSVMSIGGMPVGFSRQAIFDAEGGGKVSQSRETSLTPRSPSELTAKDTARDEEWDAKGHVQAISYAEGEGGEVSEQVVAKRASGSSYTFEGTHLGKKISGTFKTKVPEGLLADTELWSRTKKLMAGTAAELRFETYSPSTDPTAPLTVSLKPISRPEHTVKATLGKMEITTVIDADGRTAKFEVPIGAGVLKCERVFTHGSP